MNLLWVSLTITTLAISTHISYCTATSETHCNNIEKQSLLSFKAGLVDPSDRLASWVGGEDCCNWAGVVCHNLTGHVLELHLGGNATYPNYRDDNFDDDFAAYERSCLGGNISHSLLDLRHLRYLDLSNNEFRGGQIPEFFGSMQSLWLLNLSASGFEGMVPPQLGNLSNLLYLNIGQEENHVGSYIFVQNLEWLSGLPMLNHLDMHNINIGGISNWFQQISALPFLKELHLGNCYLSDVPQLPNMNLSRLEILDLSQNQGISSYSFLEMFHFLVSLDISGNRISGPLAGALQNLTSLRDVDLSNNLFNLSLPDWIYSLSKLENLMLGSNSDLQGDLSDGIGNLSSLTDLDVSYTSLQLDVKGSFRTLCNLELLDLSGINLGQDLTYLLETTLKCSSGGLQHLSLYQCGLSGPIPKFIGSLSSLNYLDLSDNQLIGTIPPSFGQLIHLNYLDLSNNSLQGTVSDAVFSNLTRLELLVASYNQISWRASPDWVPSFQLIILEMSYWQLGPKFPEWLQSQNRLAYLELVGTRIKDVLPTWLCDRSSQFSYINLTSNSLYGDISKVILSARYMDLSNNNFTGLLPSLSGRPIVIDFSYNSFSGPITKLLCHKKDEQKNLQVMILRNNQLSGEIPDCWTSWQAMVWVDLQKNILTGNIPGSIGSLNKLFLLMLGNNSLSGVKPRFLQNCSSLITLDLSHNLLSGPVLQLLCNEMSLSEMSFLMLGNNQLSGEIPDCWSRWPNLRRLELQENELTGHLPDSIGSLKILSYMHLQKNNLLGELPSLMQNCTRLKILDIGENKFGGKLPKWIGESFVNIRIMRLRSNSFTGSIPNELCGLQKLKTLDIADNNLSGYIPKCIFNFYGMANKSGTQEQLVSFSSIAERSFTVLINYIRDSAILVSKGSSREYTSNLQYTVFLDLSNNSLSGHIPEEITNLAALISLNLSSNMLSGRIPKNMGNMTSLESIDLSFNRLSGEIPQSMASMTALSFLNLSYNSLTGIIPTSTQFSTFSPSSFLGNNLIVATLAGSNNSNRRTENDLANHDHHWVDFDDMYVSAVVGFVVGFGIVVAPLLYIPSWRLVYFRIIGSIQDSLWELIVLPIRVRFRRPI